MEFVDPIYNKKDLTLFRKKLRSQVNGDRNLLFFELGLATALRQSDLLDLTVKDVKYGIIRVRSKKRNKAIEIRLNDRVHSLAKAYIDSMDDDEKLFKFYRSTANRFLKKAAHECGLEENVGTHTMRKTKAYHLYIDSGYNISLVMDLLQHDEEGSTLSYIGWKKQKLEEELSAHDL
ncbi:tyrosine-type recombinase/integrase [Halobacillus faecis]|uniref:Site-specific integrase n=1 Tax=Halobacillus faecis TaxID=360184 RepID=A0A511WX42_9BACI|nr:tyrosine-type recombinase/integrase [Halobacillus faecis]GEN55517.1 site-specific integrase [Halobacillus faecis]